MIVDGQIESFAGCLVNVRIAADINPPITAETNQVFIVKAGGPRKIWIRVIPRKSPIALGLPQVF